MNEPDHIASTRAVYDHSASQYVNAVGTRISADFETPIDRAMLDAFAEMVCTGGAPDARPRVLDIGCGSGRATAHLDERGLEAAGVDISSEMVRSAREAHPALVFEVGTLDDVPAPDESIAGAVYWYSIIATPLRELTRAWRELDRVLSAGGLALVAFQAGSGEAVERPDAYGSSTPLTLYRHSVSAVTASLLEADFRVTAETVRQPVFAHETTPQAFLFAQRNVS